MFLRRAKMTRLRSLLILTSLSLRESATAGLLSRSWRKKSEDSADPHADYLRGLEFEDADFTYVPTARAHNSYVQYKGPGHLDLDLAGPADRSRALPEWPEYVVGMLT